LDKWDIIGRAYIALIIAMIYLPIVLMILLSFNTSARPSFPLEGFTTHWYTGELKAYEYVSYIPVIHHWQFWDALRNSVYVSTAAAGVTCLLVTTTALALRHRVKGRDILFYLLLLGFIVPAVLVGLGNIFLYRMLGIQSSFWNIVFIDVTYAVPFGLILMMARFDPYLMEYERTASVLRASPIKVFRYVTLPLIKWEVLSSAVFGFLLSWGEVIRTSFVVRGTGVVSTFILQQMQSNPITTKWFAAGSVIAFVSLAALTVLAYLLTK